MFKERAPSRFIAEIPAELLTVAGVTAAQEPLIDEYPDYYRGCGVFHDDYGPGLVTRKWRSGKDTLVAVRFAGGKEARFVLEYARLERISADDV